MHDASVKTIITAGIIALLGNTALATQVDSIKALPNAGEVTLTGVVDNVHGDERFTLRDATGTIDVDVAKGQSLALKKGDRITVNGKMDAGLLSKDIDASEVTVNPAPTEISAAGITKIAGLSVDTAQSIAIGDLPKEGVVQVSGIVTQMDDRKEFTLQDTTGTVNISLQSETSATLAKGSQVTVTGYVRSGPLSSLLGKDIRATSVIITGASSTGSR